MKKVVFYIILIAIPIVIIELFFRLFFAFKVGPNVLFFGTSLFKQELQQKFDPKGFAFRKELESKNDDVMWHNNYVANYSKYQPGEERMDDDENGNRFSIKMNDMGFRGHNYSLTKEPGIKRIITLGASSTFGYHDRDNQTYPYYMQSLLNKRLQEERIEGIRDFEVINLGIPHLKAKNNYSLFMNEALKLNPDIVTFYEGINDATSDKLRNLGNNIYRGKILRLPLAVYWELRERLMLLVFFAHLKDNYLARYRNNSNKLHKYKENIDKLNLDETLTYFGIEHWETWYNFINYLNLINKECKRHHIIFIVASQQACSCTFPRNYLTKISYKDEVNYIIKLLERNEPLTLNQLYLLKHAFLMEKLKLWSAENNILFVDIISSLDKNRDCLLSWVHLSQQGNKIIAQQLVNTVYDFFKKSAQAKEPIF